MEILSYGIALIFVSGLFNGAFASPMKLIKGWYWENMWLGFGSFGLLILPLLVTIIAVPQLPQIYAAVPGRTLLLAILMGIGWGTGSLLFGLGISMLGLSLGYAIIMGTTTIFGSLIPALILEIQILSTSRGMKLLASLALVSVGLLFCLRAGKARESNPVDAQLPAKRTIRKGITICFLAGILSALFNIGFALMGDISKMAERMGASSSVSGLPIWTLIMGAGFIPNLVYCLYLGRQHQSIALFRVQWRNWFLVLLMGILWMTGVWIYGVGAAAIGAKGAVIGWPILMSTSILTGNVIGIISGEWTGDRNHSARIHLIVGLALLLAAVFVAGAAGVY